MPLNSALYILVLLPVTVAGYFLLSRYRWTLLARIWLLLASLVFYAWFSLPLLLLALCSVLVNYVLGRLLGQQRIAPPADPAHGDKPANIPAAQIVLGVGILFNIALLGYWKYAGFLVQGVNSLLHAGIPLPEIILPLGISYYTFQQIAYLVDCYRSGSHEKSLVNYCLFITFFPKVVAGPILRAREMLPQLERFRIYVPDWRNIAMGLSIFSLGLFKKVVVADSFAAWVSQGFAGSGAITFFTAWGCSLSYTLQLYYDFSGYSDMAIGSALFCNIRLPINFNSPYQATDIQDFWRRWHLTLSRWLRDYLYIPLGGNRAGAARTYANIMITFLLAGLWHGAGWTFVLWGGLHGLALAVCRAWKTAGLKLHAFWGWLATFLFVNCAWVFFRADTFADAMRVLKGMAGMNGLALSEEVARTLNRLLHFWPQLHVAATPDPQLLPLEALGYLVLFGLVAFLLPNSLEVSRYLESSRPAGTFVRRLCPLADFRLPWAVAVASILVFAMYTMFGVGVTDFIYFNF